MAETTCAGCGATMQRSGVCPVCELPDDLSHAIAAPDAAEPPAATLVGRLWQSGRAAVMFAALLFALATVVPLWRVQLRPPAPARVGVSPTEMILESGPLGTEMKSLVMVALPAAAIALFQLALSRRTRRAMLASRPLLLVLAVMPVAAGLLPAMRLGRLQRREYSAHVGMVLLGLGAAVGAIGASRFGHGVPDEPTRAQRRGEED